MPVGGPLGLVLRIAELLDELGIPYALGGSMASSLVGEPRTTVDVDIAVMLDAGSGQQLIERLQADFYVPQAAATEAISAHSCFNILDTASALEADLFVVGDGLLDRMQLQRRVLVPIPGAPEGIWVTSTEDQNSGSSTGSGRGAARRTSSGGTSSASSGSTVTPPTSTTSGRPRRLSA